MSLPLVIDTANYARHFHDEAWQQVALVICTRHHMAYETLQREPQGENIIFLVDRRWVIKIFAPFRDNYARETVALEYAHGKLSINTPELLHTGEIDGWCYLVTTQVPGQVSREVWSRIGARNRLEIISRLGAAMREMHTLDAPLQTSLNRDWFGFLERQAEASVARQRACQANPEWLERLPQYIAERLPLLRKDQQQVFLHGDIHAGNLLLAEEEGQWRITGLIDFGDSLCGFKEYEFIAPGVLMAPGNAHLQRAMLFAYGYRQSELDLVLRARLMLLTILYECSDLRKYALRLCPNAIRYRLSELEAAIWSFCD